MSEYTKNFKVIDFVLVFLSVFLKYMKFTFSISSIYIYILFYVFIFINIIGFQKLKVRKNELVKIIILFIFCLCATFFTNTIDFVMPFLFVLFFYRKDYKQYLFYLFISSCFCFAIVLIGNNVGIIEASTMNRQIYNGKIIVRSSIGFEHVNSAFVHYTIIVLLWYYLFKNNKLFYIVNLTITLYIFNQTNSRTGFMCLSLFFLLSIFNLEKIAPIIQKLLPLSFLLLFIVSIVITGNFEVSSINELLTNRPYYWNYCFQNLNEFSLFGNEIPENIPIDNLYLYILFKCGILVFLVYIVLFIVGAKKITDKKLMLTLIMFGAYALFESNHVYYINYTMFIIYYYFIKCKKDNYSYDKNDKSLKNNCINKTFVDTTIGRE